MQSDGTFLGEYVHGGKISEEAFYRVWVRDQEYAEGKLLSGKPARDDGFARKAGFRYDRILGSDLDFTFSGSFATRRVEHVMDLSYRLFEFNGTDTNPLNLSNNNLVAAYAPKWAPYATGTTLRANTGQHAGAIIDRYENYEDMPQDGAHVRAKLSGVTENDLEWSLATYAEHYDTSLGHVGFAWQHTEYDLDFRANRPIGDNNHLAFGFSYRHTSFDVDERVTDPWNFPIYESQTDAITKLGSGLPPTFIPPILEYGNNPNNFDRITGFLQNSSSISDKLVLSYGAKYEDSDLTGSSFQPGARISYTLDNNNIIWGSLLESLQTTLTC